MRKKLMANKKFKFLSIAVIIIAAAGGYYFHSASQEDVEVPAYREAQVSRGNLTIDLISDGSADLEVTNLAFQVAGQLDEVLVHAGQIVTAGETLARLDDTDYVNKLTKAEQDYELGIISGQRQIDNLKYQLDTLESEYNAMMQIPECYTEKELDDKKQVYENARSAYEAQLNTYEITLARAATDIKTAEDELNDTVLLSSHDAEVLAINYSQGETIPENNTCIVLLDDCDVEVLAPVSEMDISNVYVGQEIEAIFDAYEDEIFTGNVTFIDSVPTRDSSGLVSYEALIQLDDGRDQIKTGMTCTITFIIKQVKDVLIIPNKAVSMIDGQQIVQVKNEDESIANRVIKAGFTDGINVEVMEGLKVGETVLVRSN